MGLFCLALECRSCRHFTWVRHFRPVLLGAGMQILSLFRVGAPLWACSAGLWNADLVAISHGFHVGAPLWACSARLWNADFVAISRGCATLGLFCLALECRSCRYFTWVRHLGPVLLGSGMQILSLFHVGAPLWACSAELWSADPVAISRRCATLGLLCWALKCRSCRYFT